MIVGGIFSHFFFLKSFKVLEENEINEQVEQFHYVLNHELDDLAILTKDWAAWDDSYDFIQNENQEYIDSNLVDGTFEDLGINFAIYFIDQGSVVFEKGFDLENSISIDLGDEIRSYFTSLIVQSPSQDFFGILKDNTIPVLFAAYPILTSLDEGPSRGTLVFGKNLESDLYDHIVSSVNSEISIFIFNEKELNGLKKISDDPMIYVYDSDSEKIRFKSIIYNIKQHPLFIVEQIMDRTIYLRGLASTRDLLIAMASAGVVASVISMLALEKGFLGRLFRLSNGIKNFESSKLNGEEMLVGGGDELSELSRIIHDALSRLARTRSDLAGHLDFEKLLVTISSKFINLPIEELDEGINQVLEVIGKYSKADRSYILILREDEPTIMDNTHEWCSPGTTSVNEEMQNTDVRQFGWWFNQMIDGNSVCIDDVLQMPIDAKAEQDIFLEQSIKSIAIVPLFISGDLIGFLGFDAVKRNITWSEQTVVLLDVVGNMIANALDRRQHERSIILSQLQQARLNQITRESILKMNVDSTCRSLSKKIRSLIDADNGILILDGSAGNFDVFISGRKLNSKKVSKNLIEQIIKKSDGKIKVFQSRNQSGVLDIKSLGKSLLALPLTTNKKLLGMALFASNENRRFSVKEKALCQQAAPYITLAIMKNRALESARRWSDELNALRATIADITSELEISKLLQTILERAIKLLRVDGGDFCVFDEEEQALRVVATYNMSKKYLDTWMRLNEGAAGKAASERKTIVLDDYSSWDNKMDEYDSDRLRAAMVAPLIVGDRLLGTVGIFHYDQANKFSRDDQHLLALFAQHASIALDNAMLFEKVQYMARIDELTGQLNRRAFKEIGDYEVNRAIRLNHPIALAMVDLDDFKHVNDTYSHQIGDDVLKEVSKILRKNIRNIDIIGRYGGDESTIIMPETDRKNAVYAMERLKKSIEDHSIKINGTVIKITASIGLVAYPNNPPPLDEMMANADAAMYQAKNMGKNRVCINQNSD